MPSEDHGRFLNRMWRSCKSSSSVTEETVGPGRKRSLPRNQFRSAVK